MPECSNEIHEAATDCIVNALYLIENVKEHQMFAKVLQNGIYGTLNAFTIIMSKEEQEDKYILLK